MAYQTLEPPLDPQALPRYLSEELRRIQAELAISNWIDADLQNGWVTYSTTWPTAQFRRTFDGTVHLRGLIKGGTTTDNTVLFKLPEGYRPIKAHLFITMTNPNAIGRVDIKTNGDVAARASFDATVNASWYSLFGVSFTAGR